MGFASGQTFQLRDEDHTLANALRFMLNKNNHVEFCGYSQPHPTEALINLRVQTDGLLSAQQAFQSAVTELQGACDVLSEKFEVALAEHQAKQQQQKQDEI